MVCILARTKSLANISSLGHYTRTLVSLLCLNPNISRDMYVPVNLPTLNIVLISSEDDKDKTLLKYYAKQQFLIMLTPNRGTGETRQETTMLRDYFILYLHYPQIEKGFEYRR